VFKTNYVNVKKERFAKVTLQILLMHFISFLRWRWMAFDWHNDYVNAYCWV